MSRQHKTPRQRAEEALAVAERHVERLEVQQAKLATTLANLKPEVEAAKARRDHLKNHPDLQNTQPRPTTTGETTP